jgi:hypothetical protein
MIGTGNTADNYGPPFFASAVLPDGRVIVNGGEAENSTPPNRCSTNPAADLTKGNYMLQNCRDGGVIGQQAAVATITGTNVAWTTTSAGKADANNEEGWTLAGEWPGPDGRHTPLPSRPEPMRTDSGGAIRPQSEPMGQCRQHTNQPGQPAW